MPIGAFKLNSIGRYLAPASAPARTPITWTAVGNAQIDTAQSKFDGSSALFDANGDYLSTGNNAVWSYDANQNFTWEMWWRSPTATAFNGALFNNPGAMMLYVTTDAGNWKYAVWNGAGNNYVVSSALTIAANTWYHVAFTRSGDTMQLWHNGTQVGTASGLSGAIPSSNGALIGMYSNTFYMNGWIDELRISKGIARYTGSFTPSASPFTNDQYTSTLLHFNAADATTTFTDDATTVSRSARNIVKFGNAQVSTTQNKFGGASLLVDGTGDWLTIGSNSPINTTGNLTVEFWIRPATVHSFWMISQGTVGVGQNNGSIDIRYSNATGDLSARFISQATECVYNVGTTWSGTWKHIAFVRSGTSALLFIDGTLRSTQTYSTAVGGVENIYVGARYNEGSNFNGNIDELRISNNARYTSTFTPATAAFTNDANTLLLIHADGTNGSTTFTDDNA